MENIDLNKLKNDIRQKMSTKRYIHTLGVAEKAKELAIKYKVDLYKVELAALLHDVCKEMDKDKLKNICKEKFPNEIDKKALENTEILHGFVGAVLAQEKYGIIDNDVLDAIKYHTIGKKSLCLIGRIIYIADVVEKNRDYPEVYEMRKEVDKDMDQGIIYSIEKIIAFSKKKEVYIHPNTLEMYEWLKKRRNNEL